VAVRGGGAAVRPTAAHRHDEHETERCGAWDGNTDRHGSCKNQDLSAETRTGLCRHSNPSLLARGNSAGKMFGEARDWAGIFGDASRFLATETALSRVSGGAAEC
jgi:hypothetical protein